MNKNYSVYVRVYLAIRRTGRPELLFLSAPGVVYYMLIYKHKYIKRCTCGEITAEKCRLLILFMFLVLFVFLSFLFFSSSFSCCCFSKRGSHRSVEALQLTSTSSTNIINYFKRTNTC